MSGLTAIRRPADCSHPLAGIFIRFDGFVECRNCGTEMRLPRESLKLLKAEAGGCFEAEGMLRGEDVLLRQAKRVREFLTGSTAADVGRRGEE